MSAGDIMAGDLFFLSDGVQWMTTTYWQPDGDILPATPGQLAGALENDLAPEIAATQSSATKMGCIQVRAVKGTSFSTLISQVNVPGTIIQPGMPANNAYRILRYGDDSTAIFRNTNFISGLDKTSVEHGLLTEAFAVAAADLVNSLNSDITETETFRAKIEDKFNIWHSPLKSTLQPQISCMRSRTSNPCTVS